MSTPRDRIEAKLGMAGPALQRVRDAPPRIPDHELIRRIGQGSYGEVWLARNALGTWRAVKIVYRDSFKDARPYEREFAGIRRFEPLSRTNEGLVDILQVGRDDAEGWFYYVMELADDSSANNRTSDVAESEKVGKREGERGVSSPADLPTFSPATYTPHTLSRDLAQRGRLLLEDCLELGLTLSLALGHLHRHGLIHRDIKPSNIIFVGSVPKLADIGLVTEAAGANTFVGTEGFVPPEGPVSPQADIFALGKVLYEAAMGKDRNEFPEPFTQISTDRESIALMELNSVLLRACAPDPKKRYASAEEMHADLALLHSGGSVKRRHQFERQFRIAKQVGVAAIAATIIIGAALFWQRQQTQKMTRLAEEKVALATEKTRLADNLTKLDAENRNRIVRLDIANGVRLLSEGDPAGALLWFADALPLVTNNPAEGSIHRIRIQETLSQTPRVLQVMPHDSGLLCSAFSSDGQYVATGTKDGKLRVWNAVNGNLMWGPKRMGSGVWFVRFSRNGQRLFASSSQEQLVSIGSVPGQNFCAVLEAGSGLELFRSGEISAGVSTNLICSAFSPDDRWLAVSQKDNVIRMFDLESGQFVAGLRGHSNEVWFLSFSADGNLLASASIDRTVRLWRLPSGDPLGAPLEHQWPVVRAILSGDGRHLITGSFERAGMMPTPGEHEILAWEVSTGRRLGNPIKGRDGLVMFVEPGAQRRFCASEKVFDFESPVEPVLRLEIPNVQCWDFSNDGSQLALGGEDYTARVFDAKTGALRAGPFRHGRWVMAVRFSPDGRLLLTGSDDGNARLWDLRPPPTESLLRRLPAPMQPLPPEGFRSDFVPGRLPDRVPICLKDPSLRIIGENLEELHQFRGPHGGMRFRSIAGGWESHLWAMERYAPDTKAVLLWRPEGEGTQELVLEHPDEVYLEVFTRDDRFLVTLCGDRAVRFWRTSDGGLERTIASPKTAEGHIGELSPDGRTAMWVRSSHGGLASYQFLDLESGEIIGEPCTLQGAIFEADFSPDGKRVAFLDLNGPVTVLESRTGRLISSTIAHTSNLTGVEWDQTGSRLLTAGNDDQALVWDVETGTQLLVPLSTPGASIRLARWSPDGRFIITRSDNKTAQVWDAATGEPVTAPLKHDGEVAFAFMGRGHRLITASFPDLLRAWDLKEAPLAPEVLADYAKLLSGRRLGAAGTLLVLRPEELASLDRSLHARAPQLFE